jgi:hypothetical protein
MEMEKYMGYRATTQKVDNYEGRDLPMMEIDGTKFIIDLGKLEFRQLDNADNRITMINVHENLWFSHMLYDTMTKNHYAGEFNKPNNIPDHVRIVMIPPLKELDPVGLARRHGFRDDHYTLGRQSEAVKKVIEFRKETSQQKHVDTKRKKGFRV